MDKKRFFLIEIVAPLGWFVASVLWQWLIRGKGFLEVLIDAGMVTFLLYVVLNVLVVINFERFFNEK